MQLHPLLKVQLVALHGACVAMAYSIDQILAMEQETEGQRKEKPRAGKKKQSAEPESEECQHPLTARQPMPTMGKPERFRCRACGKEVNG